MPNDTEAVQVKDITLLFITHVPLCKLCLLALGLLFLSLTSRNL